MSMTRAFLSQFLKRFVQEGLPVALAGGIGTLACSYIATSYIATPQPPQAHGAAPVIRETNEEMIRLMRDEHALILDFLKRQSDTKQISGEPSQKKPVERNDDEVVQKPRPSMATHKPSSTRPVRQNSFADPLPIAPSGPVDVSSADVMTDKDQTTALVGRLWSGATHLFGEVTSVVPPRLFPLRF